MSSLSRRTLSIFDDIPPTKSDETAKALVEGARSAFESARNAYWAGLPGPYALEGKWSLATFEALATSLESKWRLAYDEQEVFLFGDPKDVHEEVTNLLAKELEFGVEWESHPDTPQILRGFRGQHYLFANKQSATRKWRLTPSSSSLCCKEADALFTGQTATSAENGLAIEIAHANESFPVLCHEIVNWTSGEGDRVLLAVGIKLDTKSPYQRDPQLRLVVRDSTPTSTSVHCKVYDFGNGSNIVPRHFPHVAGPPTPVLVASEQRIEDGHLQHLVPADPQAEELIVELPVGAAFFHELQPETFSEKFDLLLTNEYVADMKAKCWSLDLGYLRHRISEIIENDAVPIPGLVQEHLVRDPPRAGRLEARSGELPLLLR
ncbi:hypothetical protein DFH09DRAFT_1402336 [Mycena vulgaris]|nr:hypothetical protein DFH09DRAFT_1402336 [Mycena vulgaris]